MLGSIVLFFEGMGVARRKSVKIYLGINRLFQGLWAR